MNKASALASACLFSITPEEILDIAEEKTTAFVMRSVPKLQTPFPGYLYATKKNKKDRYGNILFYFDKSDNQYKPFAAQTVAGEVEVTAIQPINYVKGSGYFINGVRVSSALYRVVHSKLNKHSGYLVSVEDIYIYDTPRLLTEFTHICRHYAGNRPTVHCRACQYYRGEPLPEGIDGCCDNYGLRDVTTPPAPFICVIGPEQGITIY